MIFVYITKTIDSSSIIKASCFPFKFSKDKSLLLLCDMDAQYNILKRNQEDNRDDIIYRVPDGGYGGDPVIGNITIISLPSFGYNRNFYYKESIKRCFIIKPNQSYNADFRNKIIDEFVLTENDNNLGFFSEKHSKIVEIQYIEDLTPDK